MGSFLRILFDYSLLNQLGGGSRVYLFISNFKLHLKMESPFKINCSVKEATCAQGIINQHKMKGTNKSKGKLKN